MTGKIARFRELREQMRHKANLETQREELIMQQIEQKKAAVRLENEMLREQEDVAGLQSKSLKSLFYGLTGKKEQKLEQEQKEAAAARMKYETALRDLEDIEYRLNRMNEDLAELGDYGEEYNQLLKELMIAVNDEEIDRQMESLNNRMTGIADTKKEISQAQEQIDGIRTDLMEADRWASSVQFGGGEAEERFMFDALDNARRKMGHLQVQIEQVKSQMAMVNLETDITYHANILSDFQNRVMSGTAVKQMVKHANGQNNVTKAALRGFLEQLEYMQKGTERELDDCCENMIKLAEKR